MQAVGIAPIESIVTANNIILFSGFAKTTIMFLFNGVIAFQVNYVEFTKE